MAKTLYSAFFNKEDWAVKEVYTYYSRLVKHVSFEILHDNDLADDIVSETFIKLLEKGKVDNDSNFVAYMCAIAKNLSLNMIKERNRYESLNEDIAMSTDEKKDDILDILKGKLEEDEYNILVMRAVLEYPFNDIALVYKATASSMRGIYFRAKKKAQKLLEGLL